MGDNTPETSIIIRAFNEERFLPMLLETISNQGYTDYEIIVVDSGSYDGTPEIARKAGVQLLEISSDDFTFGYSLNLGIEASTGRYLVIVSAHVVPTTDDWLGSLIEPLRDDNVAVAYGRQRGTPDSKFAEFRDYVRTFGDQRRDQRAPDFFTNNANAAIRRDLWKEHRFDESLSGIEDIAWAKHWMERDYRAVYTPDATIFHIHRESWDQVRRRFQREAIAARQIGLMQPRRIPFEIVRELVWTVQDLVAAALQGTFRGIFREVVKYRYNKTRGTIVGLLNPAAMEDAAMRRAAYFTGTYRTVSIESPGRAVLKDIEMPQLRPGEVLIQVAYEGVCTTDLEILDGTLGYFRDGISEYPITPGHEFSGRVAVLGTRVEHLSVGDPVVAECIQSCGSCQACLRGNFIACGSRTELGVMRRHGAYAEYVVVPGRFVHKIPRATSLLKACLCEPIAVVHKGLRRVGHQLGGMETRCAVVGSGPIGHVCAQLLASEGHQVTAFDQDPRRRAAFDEQRYSIQVDDDLRHLAQFDLVVEATGSAEVLDDILRNTSAGVTILLLGLPYARRQFTFETLVAYDKSVVGSVGSTAEDFQAAVESLEKLDLEHLLRHRVPLERFEEAWEHCRERRHLKTIIEVDPLLEGDFRDQKEARRASFEPDRVPAATPSAQAPAP
jgi:threonine dehydrogenase-like Zn-dependent dehydrogenase/glycosyltransferase involved in cell wall biosynthesis